MRTLHTLAPLLALMAAACGGGDAERRAAEASERAPGEADGSAAATPETADTAARATIAGGAGSEAQESPLFSPESEAMTAPAPDVYRTVLHTSEGPVTVEVRRSLAPRGADRFYHLARHGFYDGARFFRVIDGFVAQFGLSGRPELDALWRDHPIRDDSVRLSNERGTLTFASAGEDTRTTQLFFNLADNRRLDAMGFAPIGRVVEGMSVLDSLHDGYGDGPPRGNGPSQAAILERGNEYLESEFPELDRIDSVEVRAAPASGSGG